MPRQVLAILTLLVFASVCAESRGQGGAIDDRLDPQDAAERDRWYQQTAVAPTPQMIIQQKAQVRAYQRIARIESMKWYGMSAARPRSSATPFTGIPTPRWEMPGGRPSAWTPYRGTQVYIVR